MTSVCIQPRVVLLPRVLPLENVGIPNDVLTDMLIAVLDALHAVGCERTPTNVRIAAFLCLSFCVMVHGVFLSFGLKLQNALGVFKLVVVVLIAGLGFLSLIGVPGFTVRDEYDQPNNYSWRTFWEGTNLGANAFVTGMYNVIWWVTSCQLLADDHIT